jgi:hypothetical protein
MKPVGRRFREHEIFTEGSTGALSLVLVALGWNPQDRNSRETKVAVSSLAAFFAAFAATSSAQALTAQECSAKYQAAKTAGTLGGQKWNDFRKAQCGADAAAAPAATPAATPAAPAAPKEAAAKPKKEAAPATPAAAPAGPAVYPSAVDPKYSKETAGKARMHTCVDQYNANKASNGNGGLKWIQKGGGYYSECTNKVTA